MKILAIYGNPKKNGFLHSCIDHIADNLKKRGIAVEKIKLLDKDIKDCIGCFKCLKTGVCIFKDDMEQIITQMRSADGFIIGASVRNGFFPALYKKFLERITYILGFSNALENKHVLALGSVGMAGGKKALRKVIALEETFYCNLSSYLFFRAGMPSRILNDKDKSKLDKAAADLVSDVEHCRKAGIITRFMRSTERLLMRKFMFEKDTQGLYDYVIKEWKKKGYIR